MSQLASMVRNHDHRQFEGLDMLSMSPTTSARLRRLMPAALIAASAALGGSALADPAVACAAPNTGGGYDDARYEECRKSGLAARFCCSQAGGTWTEVKVYDKNGNQVSSYYMCTGSAPKAARAATKPGVVGTVPLEPATQPRVSSFPTGVIQTLTPSAADAVG
jgi:hypothetical protein